MKIRNSIAGIALLVVFLCTPSVLKAQDGLRGALSGAEKTGRALPEALPQFAAADFDNDQKPDGAVLVETGPWNGKRSFRIELHVTGSNNNAITFFSSESGLAISALDVNHDGAPDIVVEKAFTREWIQVYLNDGHGTFHEARTADYSSPDPSAPRWRTRLAQAPPALCLPVTRSSDSGNEQQISRRRPDPSLAWKFWSERFLVQSAARAPSSSRAPPLFLSL